MHEVMHAHMCKHTHTHLHIWESDRQRLACRQYPDLLSCSSAPAANSVSDLHISSNNNPSQLAASGSKHPNISSTHNKHTEMQSHRENIGLSHHYTTINLKIANVPGALTKTFSVTNCVSFAFFCTLVAVSQKCVRREGILFLDLF